MARVWDPFLTETDRAFDASYPPIPDQPAIGARPALVLIDLYRGAFGDRPEPLLEAVRHNRSHLGLAGWTALPSLVRLLAAARAAGIPVIHVTREVELARWSEVGQPDRAAPADQRAARDRQYAIIDELAPQPGEPVLRKRSASAFATTALAAVLTQLRVDTIIAAGESTSGCVRAAVVDAYDLRYPVIVPEECVFDRTEASHAVNLYDMHRKYAHVLPLPDVETYLAELRQPSEPRGS